MSIVNRFEQTTVLHCPFCAALEDGSFCLELYDGDGLVHQCREAHGLFVEVGTFQKFGFELFAGIVAVGLHGKGCQWYEVDAVALFESG